MIDFNVNISGYPQANCDTGGISQKYAEETYEKKNNKTTEISETATDEQYPSAKAVYVELEAKQDKLDPQKHIIPKSDVSEPQTNDKVFYVMNSNELVTQIWDGGAWVTLYPQTALCAQFTPDGESICNLLPRYEADDTYATKTAFEQLETSVQIKCSVVDLDNESQSSMPNNFVFNFGEQTAITVTLPTAIANDYISGFTFISGETPTSITLPTEIKFSGTDCFDGSFTPASNKAYQVIVSRVGSELWGDVDARDYTAETEETA